jgi:DNA repair exonuclease SbcCD ATPase subunit
LFLQTGIESMRPLRLKLNNLLSHKDTEIDLAAIRAACIQGDNGAGKSGLLDGILYALFKFVLPSSPRIGREGAFARIAVRRSLTFSHRRKPSRNALELSPARQP